MIKSCKIIMLIQFIIVLLFWITFRKFIYGNDFANVPMLHLILIGFSPLILCLISIIIQILVVAVINSDSVNSKSELENKDKFWKNAFYINLFFGILTILLTFIVMQLKYLVQVKGHYDFVNNFSLFLLGMVISSVIMGILLRIKDSVLEINIFAVFSIILLVKVVFIGTLFFTVKNMFSIYPYKGDENIIGKIDILPVKREDVPAVNKESEYEYENRVGSAEDEEEDTQIIFGNDYYGFRNMYFPNLKVNDNLDLGKHESQSLCQDFLINYVKIEKKLTIYGIRTRLQESLSRKKGEINIIADELRNKPEEIRKVFANYNQILYAYLSDKIYIHSRLNLIIDALIESHDDIYNTENPEELLNKIHQTMVFGKYKNFPSYYYEKLIPYASESVLRASEKFANWNEKKYMYPEEHCSQMGIVWLYSFWARRYKEKNIDVIYEILTQIKAHYEENEEPESRFQSEIEPESE